MSRNSRPLRVSGAGGPSVDLRSVERVKLEDFVIINYPFGDNIRGQRDDTLTKKRNTLLALRAACEGENIPGVSEEKPANEEERKLLISLGKALDGIEETEPFTITEVGESFFSQFGKEYLFVKGLTGKMAGVAERKLGDSGNVILEESDLDFVITRTNEGLTKYSICREHTKGINLENLGKLADALGVRDKFQQAYDELERTPDIKEEEIKGASSLAPLFAINLSGDKSVLNRESREDKILDAFVKSILLFNSHKGFYGKSGKLVFESEGLVSEATVLSAISNNNFKYLFQKTCARERIPSDPEGREGMERKALCISEISEQELEYISLNAQRKMKEKLTEITSVMAR